MSQEIQFDSVSIYYEALWVLALFAATALLRESVGELCVQVISKGILRCRCIAGRAIDTFSSCSNGGRSLGFGAAVRLWNTEPAVIHRYIIVLPGVCWLVGLPIKLVAVSAIRGGNAYLGSDSTWALGISWIVFCCVCKIVAFIVDHRYGITDNTAAGRRPRFISYRRIYQNRFCTVESYAQMSAPSNPHDAEQDSRILISTTSDEKIGIDISWDTIDESSRLMRSLTLQFNRNAQTDKTPNGLRL